MTNATHPTPLANSTVCEDPATGLVSIATAAALTNLSTTTILAAVTAGHLPALVDVDQIKAWMRTAAGMHAYLLEHEDHS